jgi:hypothetical protein
VNNVSAKIEGSDDGRKFYQRTGFFFTPTAQKEAFLRRKEAHGKQAG